MNPVLIIADKEIRDGLRNRWLIIITLLMAGLALALSLVGSAPTGGTKMSALAVTVVSLASLSMFFVPLIGLLLSYDAIVVEADRGTLMLLLAYPLSRWQVVVGKFLGQAVLIGMAITIGYGVSVVAVTLSSDQGWPAETTWAFAGLIGSSILLGKVFIALGLLVSTFVRDRGTAAGAAIGLWLLLVLVFDLALVGGLASASGSMVSGSVLTALLYVNPADVYRIYNLTSSSETAILSGLSGVVPLSPGVLLSLLVAWIVVPVGVACFIFERRRI